MAAEEREFQFVTGIAGQRRMRHERVRFVRLAPWIEIG
jgi:hypothetical protein